MFSERMLTPQSAHLRDSSRVRRSWFFAAFFLATLVSPTILQITSISLAQTPTPPLAASPIRETSPQSDTKEPHAMQTPQSQDGKFLHVDIGVVAATLLLAICTWALVRATRQLDQTTKEHVRHSEELVQTVKDILKIDRTARLAVSMDNDDGGKPCVHLQNIGRIPVMIARLTLEFRDKNGALLGNQEVEETRNTWILPSQMRTAIHPMVSDAWKQGAPGEVRILCNCFDVYQNKVETTRANEIWVFDHDTHSISGRPAGD